MWGVIILCVSVIFSVLWLNKGGTDYIKEKNKK